MISCRVINYLPATYPPADAAYLATLELSALDETNRQVEDAAAAEYVAAFVASAQASPECPRFEGTFDPARNGDCLVECAVEHDFGPAQEEEGEAAAAGGDASGGGGASTGAAPLDAPSVLTADELRVLVVARVRANRLSTLAAEVARVEGELREAKGVAAADAAEDVGEDDDEADERDAPKDAVEDLRGELAWLKGDAHDEVTGNRHFLTKVALVCANMPFFF